VIAAPALPVLKDLVLLGGGHSHVAVLKRFGMRPIPGVRVTLVTRGVDTPYSGMLPGLIAGHYTRDEAHIDLQVLARFAGARVIVAEATGLDLAHRAVRIGDRPPIRYDVLSIDIGSTPSLEVPGATEHAVPVKPIDRFLDRWTDVCTRLASAAGPRRLAVVGGGAGGVELILAARHRLLALGMTTVDHALFAASDRILPDHHASVRRRFERILGERGVTVHAGQPVVAVTPGVLHTAGGRTHAVGEVLWTTEAAAAPWLRESGLEVDEGGFVRVTDALQSVSHPDVFAAGDIAAMVRHPRPKSGVFAVRQRPPLARNLRRRLLGRPRRRYRPQRRLLSLISTGVRCAVASRGRRAVGGGGVGGG
jgi:selenide,water dikinase